MWQFGLLRNQFFLKDFFVCFQNHSVSARSTHKDWVANVSGPTTAVVGPRTDVDRRTFTYWVCLKTTDLCACLWGSATKFWFFSLCAGDCECKVIHVRVYYYYILRETGRALFFTFDGFLACLTFWKQACDTQCTEFNYYTYHILLYVCVWVCAGLWIADQPTHTDCAGLLIVDQPYGSESQTVNDYVWCRGRRESAWQNASLCGAAILNYYTRDGTLNE